MKKLDIIIASDHVGIGLKRSIIKAMDDQIIFEDLGPFDSERCNYNEYASALSTNLRDSTKHKFGILVCGTGVGMSITANRYKGVRAVVCSEPYTAIMSRKHNDSNVLCLGSRVLGTEAALLIVQSWINTEFEAGRHQERLRLIDTYT